jgi:hypothetical protein
MKWTFLQKISYFLLAVLILCIPAFYNGFPLFFPDTIHYIYTGFENEVGAARVWLYSGFLRHVSLWETLWLVVFAQGILIAGSIYLMFKYFFKYQYSMQLAIVYTIVVGLTTAVSFHVSMLMPDIFTPIVLLSFSLLLLGKDLSRRDICLAVFLFVLSSGMHNSHLILNLGILILISLSMIVKTWRMVWNGLGVNRRKLLLLITLVACTHLSVCTLHYSKGGGFRATKGSQIFLFARLCDFGIAQSYLKEHCGTYNYSICPDMQRLNLGRHFLWTKTSLFYREGGWTEEGEAYYGRLVKDILTRPKYLKTYIIKSIEATFMQFLYYEMDPLAEMRNGQNGNGLVKKYFESYDLAAAESRQLKKRYTNTFIERKNMVQQFVVVLSALLLLLLFWDEKHSRQQKAVAGVLLVGMLVNAFVTGATSGVYDRYQSRVTWLISLPAFWFLCAKIETFMPLKVLTKNTSNKD